MITAHISLMTYSLYLDGYYWLHCCIVQQSALSTYCGVLSAECIALICTLHVAAGYAGSLNSEHAVHSLTSIIYPPIPDISALSGDNMTAAPTCNYSAFTWAMITDYSCLTIYD